MKLQDLTNLVLPETIFARSVIFQSMVDFIELTAAADLAQRDLDYTTPRIALWFAVNQDGFRPVRHSVDIVRLMVKSESDQPARTVSLFEQNKKQRQSGPLEKRARQQCLGHRPMTLPFEQPGGRLERVCRQNEPAAAFIRQQTMGATEEAIDCFHVEGGITDNGRRRRQLDFREIAAKYLAPRVSPGFLGQLRIDLDADRFRYSRNGF